MKVFVLVKECGSYSDYTSTNVAVYLHRDKADIAKSELEDELELIKRARDDGYKNMQAWQERNPPPRLVAMKARNQNKAEYEAARKAYTDWNELRREEEVRFYNSLEYLTSEQKQNLTDGRRWSYYETDATYSIEEFELIE